MTPVAGGWHFIAATAIKPLKVACQFAADDTLLYEFCYYNPMDLHHQLEKDKEESSPLQYHINFYNIKTLQEEFAKKSNIPWIWRIIYGHKLPYMKKTRKKKQVCGAACFMAAEIKFSKDAHLSVYLSFPDFLQHALRYQFETCNIHSVGGMTCWVSVSLQSGHSDLLYIQNRSNPFFAIVAS